MKTLPASFAVRACSILLGILSAFVFATVEAAVNDTHAIKLPAENAVLKSSALPGYTVALQKCGICHSADYINLQPPHMSLMQWSAEMTKMQHSYGAPIDESDIKLLSVYLTASYGDAATIAPGDLARSSHGSSRVPVAPTASVGIDVHALLDHNACLSCHGVRQTIVGPAYRDVAGRYKADPQAHSVVETHIRSGGSGRWGEVAMPPFPNLSVDELKALADFVLAQ